MTDAEMAALAEEFAGVMEEGQRALLPGLCRAAEAELKSRLRPDAEGYEEVLSFAAAWLAGKRLHGMRGEPQRFTAGDFSASFDHENGDALPQALALLKPWVAADFVFRKV